MSAWRSSNSSKSSPSLAMERGSDGGREGGQEEGKTGGLGGILCKNNINAYTKHGSLVLPEPNCSH